ncbi:Zn-dependent alcohol dehydrogenase [Haloglomus litoreum]|uniref:Zn-dependent alcohol dehydrogenase n=1 Tax=Haloglomus litoreum TaxID=3034026 RepID=UPI0023E8A75E|nr:Zn-dependent alcohol dehydrogenase [Haloglomus sp. DT116]
MPVIEAAVLEGPRELNIERVELDEPRSDEVLVDIRAVGVCHTDHARYAGEADIDLPAVLGHEGAGVVEAVGDRVSSVEPGDRVVLSVTTHCGSCGSCDRGEPFLCENDGPVHQGHMLDGTRRLSRDGESLSHFFAQSSFAERAVVPASTAVPIPDDVPLEAAALLGCGASTGIGSVLSTADVDPGSSVAVFGCGGVGMSALLGADAVGTSPLVTVDIAENRLEAAADLGATHTVNSAEEDPVERIEALTDGGPDYTFECIGNQQVQEQALASARSGGTAVMVGGAHGEERLGVHPRRDLLPGGKTIIGSVAGSLRPHYDIPRYARMYADGHLDLDALVTHTYDLDELDTAFERMEAGEGIRGVVTFD